MTNYLATKIYATPGLRQNSYESQCTEAIDSANDAVYSNKMNSPNRFNHFVVIAF